MARKTDKNVAKKSRSRIRNQKVSRSSRRNSGRNSVVKRKKKSRRKQRGKGNNNPGEYTAESDDRPECPDKAAVEEAAVGLYNLTSTFGDKSKAQEPRCLITDEQCKNQGEAYLKYEKDIGPEAFTPSNLPCKEKGKVCRRNTYESGQKDYTCQ